MSAPEETAAGAGDPRGWDTFLTPRDRAVYARAGYGATVGIGQRPAVLVVDVTEEFCGPDLPVLDAIAQAPLSCGDRAWNAVAVIRRLLAVARGADVPVAYTVMGGRGPEFGLAWARKRRGDGVVATTATGPGHVVDAVRPHAGDLVVTKAKPSAFHGTDLHSQLAQREVDTVVVCGGTTSGCVRATAVDAFSFDYRTVVVEDACFDRGEASHWMSLFDLQQKYADVVPADEVERQIVFLRHAAGEVT